MKQKDIKTLELKVKKRLNGDFLGAYNTAFKGAGLIFRDLREYVIGDSIKKIDWKASARLNDLHVKNYEEERDLKVFFLLDLSNSMDFGSEKKTKKELLLELFFILSHSVIKSRDKFGALIFTGNNYEYIDYKTGEENIIRIIKTIEKIDNIDEKIDKDVIGAFKKLEKLKINNSLVFVLSDKMDFEKSIFKMMGVINEIVYINIFDYFENNLFEENLSLNLGKSGGFLNFLFGGKKQINQYKKLRENKIKDFKLSLRSIGIDYLSVDTKTDIFRSLLIYFNKKISL